ncbi:MAG TPA: ABC transporter substrate-binding protein [Xanthobacteraceae bacterium]|nr:ABC transporter substrate-binding protein [Xanthobacteraceae bacterium]
MPSIRRSILRAPQARESNRVGSAGRALPRRAVLSMLATTVLAPTVRAQTLPVVRFVNVPLQDWLPFWVAQQNGFDKRYGIELRPVPIVGGTQTAEFAAAGDCDIATVAGVLALLAVKQRLIPNKLLLLCPLGASADAQHPFQGVVANDKIKTWKDLEGKNVAVLSLHSLFYLSVTTRMKREQVDVSKVNFVTIPLPQQVAALKAGRVDAICVGTDFAARAIHDKIGHLLGWTLGAPPFDHYSPAFLVANNDFANRNPTVLENFLKTYITAIKWIDDNPNKAKEVTAKELQITDPVVVSGFYLEKWDPTLAPDPGSVALDNEMLMGRGIDQPIDLSKYLTQMKLVDNARLAVLGK